MTPYFREGTDDAAIWEDVYTNNEYKAPEKMDGMTVLDIGGHIGSFARLCLDRGAARVISVEPAPANIDSFTRNVPECDPAVPAARSRLLPLAVGNNDGKQRLVRGPLGYSHAGYTLNLHGPGEGDSTVDVVTFATLMDKWLVTMRSFDWCKLDAEGAEYFVFQAYDQCLRRVKKWTIEFHGPEDRYDHVASRIRNLGYRRVWVTKKEDPNLTVAEFSL